MADLFVAGGVGAGVEHVLKSCIDLVDRGRDFKTRFKPLTETLESLAPVVEEIKRYNNQLGRPREEIGRLDNELRAGEELLNKCSELPWWMFPFFPQYRDQLQALDQQLVRHLDVDMQTQMARDVKETLCKVRDIFQMVKDSELFLLRGLSGAPHKPEFTVGLDEPFSKLKIELLKDGGLSILARILSISTTDETCASDWSKSKAELLILDNQTKQYSFPEVMGKMSELKVLIVTHHGFHPSELNNFEQLSSLSNLERIRLERISVPSFGILKKLKELSLYRCDTSLAFENGNFPIYDAFPNLEDLNIDYCKDMAAFPSGLCDINPLKKLSITNCHKLSTLPQEIGNLENLELLRLSSCTDLEAIPCSVGKLLNLRLLDMSSCISLMSLPEEVGNLCNLRNLYMTSCAMCELPSSVVNLQNLKVIICDEETAAKWQPFQPMLPNLKIGSPSSCQ